MLASFLAGRSGGIAPVRLRCALITESDAQVRASRALEAHPGVDLTVLAAPAEVEVILFEHGAGVDGLASAAAAVRTALGEVCYSDDGSSLAATVVRLARVAGARIAVAESCTGGLVASAITDVPGASDVFVAGVVAYANEAKVEGLSVDPALLARYGAVSAEVAAAMAEGVRDGHGATLAVATTGIAGPGGGTDAKPVGLVWFGRAGSDADTLAEERRFPGDRASVRTRATVFALDWLRRALVGD
jgi:nicotinamide-nucleotide amidase